MTGHEGGIPSVAFHPNGRLLASGGKDDQVRFWNPLTGQLVDSIGLDQAAQALKFTEDGRLLAVGCIGGTGAPHLKLIDMQTQEIVHEEHPGIGHVHSLAWSERPDGRFLAVCGPAGVALRKVSRDSPFPMEEALKLDRNRCLATTLNREGQPVGMGARPIGACRRGMSTPPARSPCVLRPCFKDGTASRSCQTANRLSMSQRRGSRKSGMSRKTAASIDLASLARLMRLTLRKSQWRVVRRPHATRYGIHLAQADRCTRVLTSA